MQKAALEAAEPAAPAELFDIREQHRGQPYGLLAAGERVPELRRGLERGGAGGEDLHVGVVIGGDLQQLGWVGEAVHLVEDDTAPPQLAEKPLRVVHLPPRSRQLAIEVLDLVETPAQARLARPPDPRKPDHRACAPRVLQAVQPELSLYHTTLD